MNNYELKYEGNIVSLLKMLNVDSLDSFLELEFDLFEEVHYTEIIKNEGQYSKNYIKEPILSLIMKVASPEVCQYALSQVVEFGHQELLPKLYPALFERHASVVSDVLDYAVKNYSKEDLTPEILKEDRFNDEAFTVDNTQCFYVNHSTEENAWLEKNPKELLELFKPLSDHLTQEADVFHIFSLVKKYEKEATEQQKENFYQALTEFLIEHDYALDYGVAPYVFCLSHHSENIENLFNQLDKKHPDFKEDLLIYLAKQFHSNDGASTNLPSIFYSSHEKDTTNFLENKDFAKLLFSKKVFPETIEFMSLESLVMTHYDYILNNYEKFNDKFVSFLKPSTSISEYIKSIDYEDKKKFLFSLSKNEKMHGLINEMYCAVLKDYLFEGYHKNSNANYNIEFLYQPDARLEKVKDLLQFVVSLPTGFQMFVSEKLKEQIENMNEKGYQEYFDIFTKPAKENQNKIKI